MISWVARRAALLETRGAIGPRLRYCPAEVTPTREEEERAIAEAARYAGLDETQLGFVRTYLDQDPTTWMFCCGSACDPCVLTIRRAVDRARELLGLPPLEY